MKDELYAVCEKCRKVTEQSVDNLLSINQGLQSELNKAQELIICAGGWIDQHWGSHYDLLPTWAKTIMDESRILSSREEETNRDKKSSRL